jgi:hypothetical protein
MQAVPAAVRDEVARAAWGDYAELALAGVRPRHDIGEQPAAPVDRAVEMLAGDAVGMRSAMPSPARSQSMPLDDNADDDNNNNNNNDNEDDDNETSEAEPFPFDELYIPDISELASLRKKDVLRAMTICEDTVSIDNVLIDF